MQLLRVADLTWVANKSNNICDMLYIFNFFYLIMVNNSNKMWYVCSVQCSVGTQSTIHDV